MAVARRLCNRRLFSSYSNVLVQDQGPIRIVSINRSDKMNCVDSHTSQELYSAFKDFENDSSVLVSILTGKGNAFCSGYDLKELSSMRSHEGLPPSLEPYSINSQGPMVRTSLYYMVYGPILAILISGVSLIPG